MKNLFIDHPSKAKETYWTHMQKAFLFAGWMLLGSLACAVHAVFPFLLKRTASNIVKKLYVNHIPA
jgi:hypothetical protein